MFVRAGGNAEETVFGVDRVKTSVFADPEPSYIVADGLYFITHIGIVLGGE